MLGTGRLCALLLLIALLLLAGPATAAAQASDPAEIISAYSAALNEHDPTAALDLFDEIGSATDVAGHHFEGREGLNEFLLANGFGTPNVHIATTNIHVVANRAVWTYMCTCSAATIEARVVTNRGKIVVFAIIPPPPPAAAQSRMFSTAEIWWTLGGLLIVLLIVRFGLNHLRPEAPPPRREHGRLLAALGQALPRRVPPD
jgi:hypothetical protein